MPESLNEALAKLERLEPEKLDEVSRRIREGLGGAEWRMSICLLATKRQSSFRKLGYATLTDYAERVLHLSGQKLGCLLGAAELLEHLPLMSEAFRLGQLGWGKIRALKSVVTPETEQQWLEYALAHRADQVVGKVTASPREWKHRGALKASLKGKPISHESAVTRVLESPKPPEENPPGDFPKAELFPVTESSALDVEPQTIRFTVEMTPDQFALYEAAVGRVQAQKGTRVSRGAAVARMAEALLDQGTSRARARHQVVVHTDSAKEEAFYETSKGRLPVSQEVLEEALKPGGHEVVELPEVLGEASDSRVEDAAKTRACEEQPLEGSPGRVVQRSTGDYIPNATIRAVYARAGGCCERCGRRSGRLDIHHKTPVSEGGDNSFENLELLCRPCHTLEHERDFELKPHWRAARASRSTSREAAAVGSGP